MSDTEYDENDSTPEGQDEQPKGGDIRALRKAAEDGKKAKREVAFLRAGIDPDDKRMSYFVKGYDGELDPNAIKQAATDAGFIAAAPQTPDPAVQQAQQGQAAVMAAASGVQPEFNADSIAMQQLEQAYAQGGVKAVLEVAAQYGVPVNSGPQGPLSY